MLQRVTAANGVVYYESPLLRAVRVPHAFSTRLGGVSGAPFDSLNLGNPSGCEAQDPSANVEENYRRLAGAIGCAGRERCSVHQVHGAAVARAVAGAPFDKAGRADAIVTDDAARVVAVRVADCVPILVAGADGRTIAAVHAGWRGVIAAALAAAIAAMNVPPSDLVVAIGPCIGFDAFEVGPEVLAAFRAAFGADAPVRETASGKGQVDLRAAVRRQALAAGVPAGQIDATDRCTHRDGAEFFSHRRDNGVTGRLAALIGPRARESQI